MREVREDRSSGESPTVISSRRGHFTVAAQTRVTHNFAGVLQGARVDAVNHRGRKQTPGSGAGHRPRGSWPHLGDGDLDYHRFRPDAPDAGFGDHRYRRNRTYSEQLAFRRLDLPRLAAV